MADLITSARAKYNISQASFTGAEDTTIAALVTACSKAVEQFCKRKFDSQTFDELYNGSNYQKLVLKQRPIISVARVAYNPTAVVQVLNNSASVQRATVAVTSTGVTLTRVASGSTTTNTILFADQVTLSALASAITAVGNGWTASVVASTYNDFASADLRAIQGAMNAKDATAGLKLHVDELSNYEIDAEAGMLSRDGAGWEGCDWWRAINYWRVIYPAGYATVPEDVQEACASWVAHLFKLTQRDPASANTFDTGSDASFESTLKDGPPSNVRSLLLPHRANRF
jgi:hypothetical protein